MRLRVDFVIAVIDNLLYLHPFHSPRRSAVWGDAPYVAIHYRRGDLLQVSRRALEAGPQTRPAFCPPPLPFPRSSLPFMKPLPFPPLFFRPPQTASAVQRPAWVVELYRRMRGPRDHESFYVATEGGAQLTRCAPWGCKSDDDIGRELRVLAEAGMLRWSDVAPHARGESDAADPRLALGDWVGMVEQVVCAGARIFIGSDRSTVSGGILNLRLELFGTAEPFYLMPSK